MYRQVLYGFRNIFYENYDIAIAMSSSRADPVLGTALARGI